VSPLTEKILMQQTCHHIALQLSGRTGMTALKSWANNYGINQPRLVGDRFEPTREVYLD
jgi:hypothetical protein